MRADGKRVKKADLIYTVVPYVMSSRTDAMNMITLDIPVEPLQRFINEQRHLGVGVSHLALVLTAYMRAAAEYPLLNRFVVGRRIYDRSEFSVSMVVLKPGAGEDDNTMSKMYFDTSSDVFTVQRIIESYYKQNQQEGKANSTDHLANTLGRIPGLLALGVPLIKLADLLGLLPKAIIDASPFHASLGVSNLASIRTNHIYHHCYKFGTTSVFMTLGNLREVPWRTSDGVQFRRCIPLGVVMDERICSGHYFALAFARIRKYLNDPQLLTERFQPPAAPGEK